MLARGGAAVLKRRCVAAVARSTPCVESRSRDEGEAALSSRSEPGLSSAEPLRAARP